MNLVSFIDLILEIFYKKNTNINKIYKKGLLAVKIGQVFALRIDFLTPSKCSDLSRLYNSNVKISSNDFLSFSTEGFDDNWIKNFTSINPQPLASASIAQVHSGILLNGDSIVIKTIKKDRAINFKSDTLHIKKLFKILIFLYPKLKSVANPIDLIDLIEKNTLDELDLENEIINQSILKNIWQKNQDKLDLPNLSFPKLYTELSNKSTLVSEEIKGFTFDELLSSSRLPYSLLLELFVIQGFYMFSEGIFHGDLHPANIMLYNNSIFFIDCGTLGYSSKSLRLGLFNFMKYLSLYDFKNCAKSLYSMSTQSISNELYDLFVKDFLILYQDFPQKTVSQKSLTRQMMETIKLGINYTMAFPKEIFDIIKSLMYMDGMVLKCNPDANLIQDMRPYITILEKYIEEGDENE